MRSENSGQGEESRKRRRRARRRPAGREPLHRERARDSGARTGENRSTGCRAGEEAAPVDGRRKRLAALRQRDGRAAHAAVVHAGQQKERAHPAPDAAQHPVSFVVAGRFSARGFRRRRVPGRELNRLEEGGGDFVMPHQHAIAFAPGKMIRLMILWEPERPAQFICNLMNELARSVVKSAERVRAERDRSGETGREI